MNIQTARFIPFSEVAEMVAEYFDRDEFIDEFTELATFTFGDAEHTLITIARVISVLENMDVRWTEVSEMRETVELLELISQDIFIDMEN